MRSNRKLKQQLDKTLILLNVLISLSSSVNKNLIDFDNYI